jgi:endonuclease YncB( thermonuclease family)
MASRNYWAYQATATRWLHDTTPRNLPYTFKYNAYVKEVHDGDTFNVDVDWGKRRWEHDQPIRLVGAAARELHDPGGPEAQQNLAAKLPRGTWVGLKTVKDDKFAPRWDCIVEYYVEGILHDLAADLINDQWAAPWDGHGEQPKPPWPRTVS